MCYDFMTNKFILALQTEISIYIFIALNNNFNSKFFVNQQ